MPGSIIVLFYYFFFCLFLFVKLIVSIREGREIPHHLQSCSSGSKVQAAGISWCTMQQEGWASQAKELMTL